MSAHTPGPWSAELGYKEARRHADADMDTGKRGWLCQCGACRLVRIALYDGAGNAEKP